jgi:hypothetical protein
MAYDGDSFVSIDEDGYAADRPMSTWLGHATRNNLYHLGNFGHQCSYSDRLNADGAAGKIYSGNPSGYYTWLMRVSRGTSGIEINFTAAAGPSAASSEEGDAWVSVRRKNGKVEGSKVSLTNTTDETTYNTYTASVSFGETTTEDELMVVSLMVQSADYATDDSTITIEGGYALLGIRDADVPFARSQMAANAGAQYKVEVMGPDDSSIQSGTQPGSPIPFGGQLQDQFIRDLTYVVIPSAEVRELRDFDPYVSQSIRAHDSVQNAKVLPTHDEGGGDNFRASNRVFGRWHFASIGTQYSDKPNVDWDEFPRWTYVDSSGSVTKSVPIVLINDKFAISVAFAVIGYVSGSSPDEVTYDEEIEVVDQEDLTFSATIDGSDTVNATVEVPYYRRNPATGVWPFFTTIEIYERFSTASPTFPYREGQLFDIAGGNDERDLLTPVLMTGDLIGYTAGDIVEAELTFPAPTISNRAYVVATLPVIQQYVTRST